MKRTIRLPGTLWKTATTLALVALTCGTALGNPSPADCGGGEKNEILHAAHNHGDHDDHGGTKKGDRQIPDQVTSEHWAYKEITELLQKYSADKELPAGRTYSRGELADCLLAVLNRIVERYDKEGAQAIQKDDLENIAGLQTALEGELSQQGAYQTIRKSVEEILVLVEYEAPAFQYKFGVNGILRSDVVGNFRLPDSSFTPGRREGRIVYRIKPYAYWHPADWLDIHMEGQGYGFDGGSQHTDKFNLYQGFVEAKLPGSDRLALKGGRQEFNYGSSFILGADSFYDGLSFDAVRLRVKPLEDLTVDLLGGSYAAPWADGVKGDLWGAYATYAPSKGSAIEAYLFRDAGSDDHHKGEYRDTYGLRSTSTLGPLTLEFEPVFQSGRLFNPDTGLNEEINAYGGHIDLAGEAKLGGIRNTIFLSYAAGSGDNSGRKEFGNPNNDNSLVGDMGVIGALSGVDAGGFHASGIQAFTLGWGIDLADNINLTATGRKFMANAVPDGFGRYLGVEADFTLAYNISKDFSAIIGYDHFFTGKFFRDATGSDKGIDYGYAMLVFNLDKTKKRMAMRPVSSMTVAWPVLSA
jgi:hypothetical protein